MLEPLAEIYSDEMGISVGPLGCSLSFSSSPAPVIGPADEPPQPRRPVVIRLSLEHLKLMAYILRNQVRGFEQQSQVQIPITRQVLDQLAILPEQWEECWGIREP